MYKIFLTFPLHCFEPHILHQPQSAREIDKMETFTIQTFPLTSFLGTENNNRLSRITRIFSENVSSRCFRLEEHSSLNKFD